MSAADDALPSHALRDWVYYLAVAGARLGCTGNDVVVRGRRLDRPGREATT